MVSVSDKHINPQPCAQTEVQKAQTQLLPHAEGPCLPSIKSVQLSVLEHFHYCYRETKIVIPQRSGGICLDSETKLLLLALRDSAPLLKTL